MLEGENNLIRGAQKGKAKDFGTLYDHYMPPIYRFVFMKLSHKQEAEDLTHDVFVSAWNNINSYSPQGHPFSSWLYQIARNKVIDYYRLKKPISSIDNVAEENFKLVNNIDLAIDLELDTEIVKKSINQLTPDQQDVIIMRFIEDLTHPEIAAALNKTEGAVRLLQHRAINNLKNILNNGKQTY
jgi:RNA polymerase sigma-70 factor, ECF subfamily